MKKKNIFLSLILLTIIALAFSFWFKFNEERKARFGLDGFYELTQKDPLFYSPFLDTEGFEAAIKKLKEEEAELKKVLITNMEAEEYKEEYVPILNEHNLVPYQLLNNLILINQKTEDFLKIPSKELANELLSLYDLAADSYLAAASSQIKILEKITEGKESPYFFFMVNSISSSQVIEDDYRLIKENGYQLKKEITKRRSCLLEKEDCQALIKIKDNSSFLALLENEEFDLEGENVDFIRNGLSTFSIIEEIRGPYKIKSRCWQKNENSEHWLYLIYYKEKGEIAVYPKLASQNYYRPIPPETKAKIYQALSKRGIKFITQIETASYECMDLTYYPQILTLDFLKRQVEKGLISEKELEENLDYKLLIENQFGLLTPVINSLVRDFKVTRLIQAAHETTIVPEYLLTTRTNYSLFYFPFSKSIWRINQKLEYFVPPEEMPENTTFPFITLNELRKMGYNETEIKKFHVLPEEQFEMIQD